jgi:hypothetical protein
LKEEFTCNELGEDYKKIARFSSDSPTRTIPLLLMWRTNREEDPWNRYLFPVRMDVDKKPSSSSDAPAFMLERKIHG